ncbi:hypothetical protein ACFXTH_032203 [Malus domestica]
MKVQLEDSGHYPLSHSVSLFPFAHLALSLTPSRSSLPLHCVGSAFNVKGIMDCPNCCEIENDEWRYYVSCSPDHELDLSEDDMDYEDSPIEFLDMGLQGTMLRRLHHGE